MNGGNMNTKMGVWIDKEKAVITSIYDKSENVQFVEPKSGDPVTSFYSNIIEKIRGAELVHIFGPSEPKTGLLDQIKNLGVDVRISASV